MYRSIVTGTDGSPTADAAMAQAFELARRCGARVHLVSVCRPVGALAAAAGPETAALVALAADTTQEHATAMRASLDRTSSELSGEGLEVTTHLLEGDPADGLLRVAESEGADLIVVGNRGMHGARRVLGSVPNTISHRAPCSVLIVRTT